MDYIIKNQNIILGWINYKLIYFLQKKNPNVPAIPFKIEANHKRELSRVTGVFKEFMSQNRTIDIYSGLEFLDVNTNRLGVISIDHFLPWSFLLHDEIWNLLPTFRNINSSKNDKLPDMEKYFDLFSNMQYDLFVFFNETGE